VIRILHVVEPANGGVPLFVRRLCEGMGEGFRFEIACPPRSEFCLAPPVGTGVHVVEMARQIHPLKDVLAALRVRALARSDRYDIVHLNSSKAGVLGLLLKGRLHAKMVFTPHALRSHAYPEGSPLRRAAMLLEARICAAADLVVAVSREEQRHLTELGLAPAEKVQLIENGVDLVDLGLPSVVSRADLGLPDNAFVVGTVARLSPQKDPIAFVRAAAIIAQRAPDAHFVMVGDGPLEREVRSLIVEADLSGRFHILGWRANATDLLKLFDVFVLTSRYEGMPFTVLEAAGARRAIVSTKAPGVRSLIDHGSNGLLVAIGDSQAIAHAVISLHAAPDLRARLGESAFETVAGPRSLELMVERWGSLYRSLARQAAQVTVPTAELPVAQR